MHTQVGSALGAGVLMPFGGPATYGQAGGFSAEEGTASLHVPVRPCSARTAPTEIQPAWFLPHQPAQVT